MFCMSEALFHMVPQTLPTINLSLHTNLEVAQVFLGVPPEKNKRPLAFSYQVESFNDVSPIHTVNDSIYFYRKRWSTDRASRESGKCWRYDSKVFLAFILMNSFNHISSCFFRGHFTREYVFFHCPGKKKSKIPLKSWQIWVSEREKKFLFLAVVDLTPCGLVF